MSAALPGLSTAWLGRSLEYFDELDSTNTYLKARAHELPHGAAVVAGRQTAAKGRLGRGWHDSENALAFSVLLHDQSVYDLPRLPLAAGLGVALALERLTGAGFGLKWSNDVLYQGKKLCGILCESRISSGRAFAVVGVGVNLNVKQEDFDRLNLVYATSLELATGKNFEVLTLAAEICNQFEPLFENIYKFGLDQIKEEYKKRCVTLGKEVRIVTDKGERTGLALDIAGDGGLVCQTGGEVVVVHSGEASVRGLHGYV